MERTNKKVDNIQRWKKIGGGSLRLGNRIIKPGQIFTAAPEDIPETFRDVIIPVDMVEMNTSPEPKRVVNKYTIVPIKSEDELESGDEILYNIIDGKGKVINEKALDEKTAKKLLKSIE